MWKCSKLSSKWGWSGWNNAKAACSCPPHCFPRLCEQPFLPKLALALCPPHYWQLSRHNLLQANLSWKLLCCSWASPCRSWVPGGREVSSAGADPVLGNEGMESSQSQQELPPSVPSCLPAVISKLLFLFVTHQELDWIQEAATFTKSCKSQPESPNFWAITKSCLATVAVFIFPGVRRNC